MKTTSIIIPAKDADYLVFSLLQTSTHFCHNSSEPGRFCLSKAYRDVAMRISLEGPGEMQFTDAERDLLQSALLAWGVEEQERLTRLDGASVVKHCQEIRQRTNRLLHILQNQEEETNV